MQQDNITDQINSLPESVVTEIAEKASDRELVERPVSWTAKPVTIQSIGTGTLGMWSVRGKFSDKSSSIPWNARIKALDPNTQDGLTNFNHPSRELSALRSGRLGNIDSGLVPVPVYGITDRPDGTVWIWMKDLSDTEQPPWSAKSYLAAARHIGMFNWVWPESAMPDGDWINTDGSTDRRLAAEPVYSSSFGSVSGMKDHKNVVRAGSRIGVERMLSLLDDVNALIEATTSLPRSVAHNDMHARNLFPRDEEVTYAIDWASVGLTSIAVE